MAKKKEGNNFGITKDFKYQATREVPDGNPFTGEKLASEKVKHSKYNKNATNRSILTDEQRERLRKGPK